MIRGIVFAVLVAGLFTTESFSQCNKVDAVTKASFKLTGGQACSTSASITWTYTRSNGEMNIEWGPTTSYGTKKSLYPTSPVTLPNLTPNTTYQFHIWGFYKSKTYEYVTSSFKTSGSSTTPNKPPVISSAATVACTTGKTLDYTVTATDPDNDPVTFTASGLPNWITFASPKLTLKPVSGSTSTTVKIIAADGKSGFDTLSLAVTVAPSTGTAPKSHAALPATINLGDLHFSVPDGENVRVSLFALNGSAIYCQTVTADKLVGTFDNLSTSTTPGVYLLKISSPSFTAQHTVSISK